MSLPLPSLHPHSLLSTQAARRILLTHKLDQITFLLTSLAWFPSHSVQKPKSSPWPTRICAICPHLLLPSSPPTLLLAHSAQAALGFSLYYELLRRVSTSGPLHLQLPLPGMPFSQIPAHLRNFIPMFPGPLPTILTLSNTFCSLSSIWIFSPCITILGQTRYFSYSFLCLFLPLGQLHESRDLVSSAHDYIYSPMSKIVPGTLLRSINVFD